MRSKVVLAVLASAIPCLAGAQQASGPNSQPAGVQAQGSASTQGNASLQKSGGTAVQTQSSTGGTASGSVTKGNKSASADAGATTNAMLSGSLDAKRAKAGDPVAAKTTEPSSTADHTLLPKGTQLLGHVTDAKAAGSGEAQSALAFTFDRAVLKDGREIPVHYTVRALAAAESAAELSTGDAMDSGMGAAAIGAGGAGMARGATMGAVGGLGATAGGSLGGAAGGIGRVSGGVAGSAGSTLGASGRALKGGAGAVGGLDARGLLTADSQGVFGMKDLSLSQSATGESNAVITSTGRSVHLDSGTRMLLSAEGSAGSQPSAQK
jgi:hypothetical protein